MGILDNKSRIVDAVITSEGRRQLASGRMKIEYYSFTDGDVFYNSSSSGITDDASSRFYFEAPSRLPHDQIVLESDDSGRLKFENHDSIKIFNGLMYQSTVTNESVIYSGSLVNFISGSDFSSQITGVLGSSIDNFSRLSVISSQEKIFGDEDFALSSNTGTLKLSEDYINNSLTVDINNIPDLLENTKTTTSINFKYLPPVYLNKNNNLKRVFGDWVNVSPDEQLTYSVVLNGKNSTQNDPTRYKGLKKLESEGLKKSIDFYTSPQATKILSQVFEISKSSSVKKLDILNAGVFFVGKDRKKKKVVFIGKVINDVETGATKFVSIFTLVFE